jgi:hypothetical protein
VGVVVDPGNISLLRESGERLVQARGGAQHDWVASEALFPPRLRASTAGARNLPAPEIRDGPRSSGLLLTASRESTACGWRRWHERSWIIDQRGITVRDRVGSESSERPVSRLAFAPGAKLGIGEPGNRESKGRTDLCALRLWETSAHRLPCRRDGFALNTGSRTPAPGIAWQVAIENGAGGLALRLEFES